MATVTITIEEYDQFRKIVDDFYRDENKRILMITNSGDIDIISKEYPLTRKSLFRSIGLDRSVKTKAPSHEAKLRPGKNILSSWTTSFVLATDYVKMALDEDYKLGKYTYVINANLGPNFLKANSKTILEFLNNLKTNNAYLAEKYLDTRKGSIFHKDWVCRLVTSIESIYRYSKIEDEHICFIPEPIIVKVVAQLDKKGHVIKEDTAK